MLTEERRVGMARRGLELCPDRQRAWICGEGLDRWHLRRVHVALSTEILGVTGGAGGGDRPCGPRQLAVEPAGEPKLPMRGGSRKVTYRGARELHSPDQWQVAGGASGVRRVEVRRGNSVAAEAVRDHGTPHLHRVGPGGDVASATGEHGLSGRGLDHYFRMLQVSKPQIARPGLVRCSPLHGALDRAVVTLLATGWGRPQILPGIGCAGVAPDAGGKDRPVLPVIETVLDHAATRPTRCCDRPSHQHAGEDTCQLHRAPARGSGGRPGGSGIPSAWLRSTSVTRAMSRVWFQSKAAASGRSRVSA